MAAAAGGAVGDRAAAGFPNPSQAPVHVALNRAGAVAGAVEIQRQQARAAVAIDRNRRRLVGQFPGQCLRAVVVAVAARVPQAHLATRGQQRRQPQEHRTRHRIIRMIMIRCA
ncbi:hypothetical protein [Nocardia asiatica]|uniref:hypothetical protein n=1 Tax=Nocardia asiatica TaxID=209252 RepID=UPI003EE08B6C